MENPDNVAFSYVDINSIRNKFGNSTGIIQNNVDVFVIAATKFDETFPTRQFFVPGFKHPYCFDISGSSFGLLVYINEQIPRKQLEGVNIQNDIHASTIELNLKNTKWLRIFFTRKRCKKKMRLEKLN